MYTRWAGATGRYQGKCEQGHCALTGGQAASKHEGEILTLLKYVIGDGRGDMRVLRGRRQLRLDMVFSLPSGLALAVEYDGAYWHGGRSQEERQHNEQRDYWKARDAEAALAERGCAVVRIREDPLEPLHRHDIQVPARSDPGTCARAVLFHLFHVLYPEFPGSREDSVVSFLRSAAIPLATGDLRCADCRETARYLLPKDAFLTQPGQNAERG